MAIRNANAPIHVEKDKSVKYFVMNRRYEALARSTAQVLFILYIDLA